MRCDVDKTLSRSTFGTHVRFASSIQGGMRRILELLTASAVAVACTVATGASAGASPSSKVTKAADVTCNTAIESGNPVSTKVIRACSIANVPTRYKCSHGPAAYKVSVPGGSALLRQGDKPQVYTVANFDLNETAQLCGDPANPSLTPPRAPLTAAQVRALFKKSRGTSGTTTTAVTPRAEATSACNGYNAFLVNFPTYLHNHAKAIAAVEKWSIDAINAGQGDPNYQALATASAVLTGLVGSNDWDTANPTMAVVTAVGNECGRLARAGLTGK
jgi:hypothetical protein